MAQLLKAQDDPAFGWFYSWVELNQYGQPKNPLGNATKQPDNIKIPFFPADKGREKTGHVIPDKGEFGPEFALVHTFPDFMNNVIMEHKDVRRNEASFWPYIFRLFTKALQGTPRRGRNYLGSRRT
jgi:hypothetical protein